ncbi:N6-adenosine-methyltransferase MT-A70-like protein [Bradysia coprophila]|uniref:N6-adenosine-methyltransferase MT-A70-like protein n=1 Tax=Bradysia coprophila TaxID=38358 RepID=UPI00187D8430|nr:N6-adenosine-methyltransferase MT-A70-like protein [Bradysia coprophila]
MSDGTWDQIQEIKIKRNSLREKLEKRKKERQDILLGSTNLAAASSFIKSESSGSEDKKPVLSNIKHEIDADPEVERQLLQILSDNALTLPISSKQLAQRMNLLRFKPVNQDILYYFLQKLVAQSHISINNINSSTESGYEVTLVDHSRVQSLFNDIVEETEATVKSEDILKRKLDDDSDEGSGSKFSKNLSNTDKKVSLTKDTSNNNSDIMSLLSMPSTREKHNKQVGEEILELLSKPTAKERSLAEKFKSQGGAQVMEFCPHGTRIECLRAQQATEELQSVKKADDQTVLIKLEESAEPVVVDSMKCNKLHFKKIIQSHTDESLGDCSFLNTCFHMDSCKYVHYEVDTLLTSEGCKADNNKNNRCIALPKLKTIDPAAKLDPPQWIQCDLRFLDMTVLGKFAVIMADPPWDIHMELPYGTMSDDEMRQLGVPALQDDGLIFLWVTGRAMELGRECLKLWGYERFDELIWVKTNQLQRIIRTGRTGHWLNHGKEHCLVGTKGNPQNLNRGLDCDVIVAEVRATSHKPDEIYGIIERLSPGTRKIELFGRPHNVQPNWITLGNQLDGIRLVDPELIAQFQKRYPDGNCMAPSQVAAKPPA